MNYCMCNISLGYQPIFQMVHKNSECNRSEEIPNKSFEPLAGLSSYHRSYFVWSVLGICVQLAVLDVEYIFKDCLRLGYCTTSPLR